MLRPPTMLQQACNTANRVNSLLRQSQVLVIWWVATDILEQRAASNFYLDDIGSVLHRNINNHQTIYDHNLENLSHALVVLM